jgi:hypothetical protein
MKNPMDILSTKSLKFTETKRNIVELCNDLLSADTALLQVSTILCCVQEILQNYIHVHTILLRAAWK